MKSNGARLNESYSFNGRLVAFFSILIAEKIIKQSSSELGLHCFTLSLKRNTRLIFQEPLLTTRIEEKNKFSNDKYTET